MIGGYFNLRIEKPGKPAAVPTQSRWAPISIGGSPDTVAQTIELSLPRFSGQFDSWTIMPH
jgi:hypothetical protein